MGELFDKDLWLAVASDLRFQAKAWWEEHRDAIIDLTKDEIADVMASLKQGDTKKAKGILAAHMTPDEWRAYRDGTTEHLANIARRRFQLYEALEELAERVARKIGSTVLGVLGL